MATWQHLRSSTANKRPTTSLADGRIAINTNTASPGLFFKDSAGTGIVKVGPVHVGTTAPNSVPASGGSTGNYLGEQWLDTSVSPAQMKVWNGSTWVGVVADELPVSKLQDGAARQLIQTDAAGTGVEWTSNVDVPGTLDVTSTATFDSIAQYPLGSAGAPTITFTGNNNTGIYSPGADQVAISTGGSGRLFVDASGNVGVKTTTTTYDSAKVGSSHTFLSIQSGASSYSNVNIAGSTASASRLGILAFVNDANSASYKYNSWIEALSTGSTAGQLGGALLFSTAPEGSAAGPVERLRITSAGLVGVGTSSPQATLHANGAILSSGALVALSASNIFFDQPTSALSRIGVVGANTSTAGTLSISQYSSNGSVGRDVLSISSAGNVGIGTTSPGSALEVVGAPPEIRIRSTTASDGFIRFTNTSGSMSVGMSGAAQNIFLLSDRTNGHAAYQYVGGASGAHIWLTANTERARIDSSGRLLVGTSSATSYGSFSPHSIESTTFSNYTLSIKSNSTTANPLDSPNIIFSRSGGNAVGSMTTVASGSRIGSLNFAGADGTSLQFAAAIEAFVDGTPGANDMPGRLVFSTTADGASSPTERMRIDNAGATTLTHPNSTSSSPHLLLVDTGDGRTASIWNNAGTLSLRGSGTSNSTGIVINHGNSYIEYTGAQYFSGVGTTASAANAFLNSGSSPANQLLRSTSSLRYKTDIENLEEERSASILNFRPVWYRSTADADRKDWSWYGLIAEEVAEIEPRLVHWTYLEDAYEEVNGEKQLKPDAEMVPDGVQYDRLTVLLLDVVKRQQQAIETLEAKVAALEGA